MDYTTVEGEATSEFTVSRSRFLSFVRGADTVEEGLAYVRGLKKTYGDATHVCYAVYTPTGEKASDDGEPRGTAGQPILSVLKKKNVMAAVAVIRWYGGVKLGAGGLVEAYTKSASDVLTKAQKIEKIESAILVIRVEFRLAAMLKTALKESKILSETYSDAVNLEIAVPAPRAEDIISKVREATSATAEIKITQVRYEIYPKGGNL